MFPGAAIFIRPEILKPAIDGMCFFPADLKTYRFRSGRGENGGAGRLMEFREGEVVMGLEVPDVRRRDLTVVMS